MDVFTVPDTAGLQAPDHPILWAADESYYLKFYIFQVVDEK